MNGEAGIAQVDMGSAPVALAPYVHLLKVLEHPLRVAILRALADSPDYPRSLAKAVNSKLKSECSEASVSYHLGALAGAGLVSREQHGKTAVYSLAPSVRVSPHGENVMLQVVRGADVLLQVSLTPGAGMASIPPAHQKIHGRVRRRER